MQTINNSRHHQCNLVVDTTLKIRLIKRIVSLVLFALVQTTEKGDDCSKRRVQKAMVIMELNMPTEERRGSSAHRTNGKCCYIKHN